MKLPNFYYENQLWKRNIRCVAGVDEVGRGSFAGPTVAAAVAFATRTTLTSSRGLRPRIERANVRGRPVYINDSKKLTARQREVADKWIKENVVTWGIGEVGVAEINRFGITKATYSAFRLAISNANIRLHNRIEFLLIDAFYIPYVRGFPRGRKKRIMGCRKRGNEEMRKLGNRELKNFLQVGGLQRPVVETKKFKNQLVGRRSKETISEGKIFQNDSRQLAIINGDSKSISIAAASIIAKVYRDKLMQSLSTKSKRKKYGWEANKGYGTKQHREAILKHGVTRHHRKQFVESFLNKQKL